MSTFPDFALARLAGGQVFLGTLTKDRKLATDETAFIVCAVARTHIVSRSVEAYFLQISHLLEFHWRDLCDPCVALGDYKLQIWTFVFIVLFLRVCPFFLLKNESKIFGYVDMWALLLFLPTHV